MNFDKISSKFNNSPEEIRNQEAEPTDTSRRKAGRRMGKYFSFFGLIIWNALERILKKKFYRSNWLIWNEF
jgi:hypothetical protein